MLRTIFKTALRIFWKEKGYALLNVSGLTLGLTACTLLLLYVESEKSVNSHLKDTERVFQVLENQTYTGGVVFTTTATPGPLKDAMKAEFPEVEYMAHTTWEQERLFTLGEESFKAKGRVASEDFFHVYNVEFIEGRVENSLTQPSLLYISKRLKERIFGDAPALGKTINVNAWGDYQVAGVFKDTPKNSTLTFDYIMPYAPFFEQNKWLEDWGNNGLRGFIKLQPGVEEESFEAKIKGFVKEKHENSNVDLFLQRFDQTYLYSGYKNGVQSGGRIVMVNLFTTIAIFILAIACINFMNLATARSSKRAKEVGVKKVVGSSKGQLMIQFLGESILMSLISAILAGLVVMSVTPELNTMINNELSFDITNVYQWGQLLSIGLAVGLVAGSYPAIFLSSFAPVRVLKGSFKTSGWSNGVRKGLVVFQFLVSTFLIIATLIVHQQINFLKDKNLGYDKENIIYMTLEGELREETKKEIFRSRVLNNPNFSHFSTASQPPIVQGISTSGGFNWEGKDPNNEVLYQVNQVSFDFIETLGLELAEGRSFNRNLKSDSMHVIINETAAATMNVDQPLDQAITFWQRTGKVIGIVKDFHFASLHGKIEPLVLTLRPERADFLFVKTIAGNTDDNLAFLESLAKELNPQYPFEYTFLNESYENLYRRETVTGTLAYYFSGIAIFISLLGLLGLASFAAEQRIKEIGIRKVLGAGLANLMLTLGKGFVILVGVGFIIATPLAYFVMKDWLNIYEYRIDIGLTVFLIAGSACILITVLTVGYHTLRAAYANPVKSLRYE